MADAPEKQTKVSAFLLRQVFIAFLIVVLALAAGAIVNQVRPDRFDPLVDWREVEVEAGYRRLPQGVLGIKFEEMVRLYRDADVMLVDARPTVFYDLGHIPGAQSAPLENAEHVLPGLFADVPPDRLVVIYCEGSLCSDSFQLARRIKTLGRERVAVYLGGIEEWELKGMPIIQVREG